MWCALQPSYVNLPSKWMVTTLLVPTGADILLHYLACTPWSSCQSTAKLLLKGCIMLSSPGQHGHHS